jgi:chaperonin GroEL
VIVDKVRACENGIGFDAVKENYVDMMKEGIIDPVKVTKSALLNAVSIASTLLTTEAAVADSKDDKSTPAGNPEMGY